MSRGDNAAAAAAVRVLGAFVTVFMLPETRGKSLEDLTFDFQATGAAI